MTKVVAAVRFQKSEDTPEDNKEEIYAGRNEGQGQDLRTWTARVRTLDRNANLRPHRDAGNLSLPPTLSYHVVTMDLRALVVCPDQDSAALLTLILSELGMAAEHTPSISRGLELIDSQRFDAIILDYRADQRSNEFFARLRQSVSRRASFLLHIVDGNFTARPVFG